MKNNYSFAIIDDIIKLYSNGLLSITECTTKAMETINSCTWFISNPDIRIKAQNVLYKRYFYKAHKAITRMDKTN